MTILSSNENTKSHAGTATNSEYLRGMHFVVGWDINKLGTSINKLNCAWGYHNMHLLGIKVNRVWVVRNTKIAQFTFIHSAFPEGVGIAIGGWDC